MRCHQLSISLADRISLIATTLQEVMKLATGAVECLSRGAAHDDPDVNAVGPNGDLFEAGQMLEEHWTLARCCGECGSEQHGTFAHRSLISLSNNCV